MVFHVVILTAGLFFLYVGAEGLVGGAARVARSCNVSPLVIGLTIVAFGTSAPELLVSLFASERGASGLSIGNVIGSNVINIALVLGLSIILNPMPIHRKAISTELLYMLAVSLLLWGLCVKNGTISRADGLILATSLAVYLVYRFFNPSPHDCESTDFSGDRGLIVNGGLVLGGTAVLCLGAHLVVKGAVALAGHFHVSHTFVGLTIVAFGTSLPELAASMVAARKCESDIAIGNVVGSNIFNCCMVMGAVGLVSPMRVDSGLSRFEFPFMLLLSVLLLIFTRRSSALTRGHGSVFVGLFVVYLGIAWVLSGA